MSLDRRGRFWRYTFRHRGKRYQVNTKLTNKNQAGDMQRAHQKQLALSDAGIIDPDVNPPARQVLPRLEEYVETFLQWSQAIHRLNTTKLHKRNCDTLIRHLGDCRLNEIQRADVEDFMVKRSQEEAINLTNGKLRKLGRKVSGATVNRAVITLELLYHKAQGRWPSLVNPCKGVKLLPEQECDRPMTDEEFDRYRELAPPKLRDAAILMRDRGLRPEDVCSLKPAHIDFKLGEFTLWPKPSPTKLVAVRGKANGKTERSTRTIVMSEAVRQVLLARVQEARKNKTDYLFPMYDAKRRRLVPGDHLRPGSLGKAHRDTMRKMGLNDRVRLYDLRHTFGTNAVRDNIHLRVIQDVMGHASPKTTQRYTKHNDLVAQRLQFSRAELFEQWLRERSAVTELRAGSTPPT